MFLKIKKAIFRNYFLNIVTWIIYKKPDLNPNSNSNLTLLLPYLYTSRVFALKSEPNLTLSAAYRLIRDIIIIE